ncbi:ABC transporter substrate-binding protein [Pseudokineococcus lusitanus]|uniref:Carbohydrate ABC transporter substrate-binding protein (CUT1 family) n=1 Tax=Pseudokineococcus lusitanus TaxID=763993 RepID=A0A3N1HQM4_9ACTN|nr:sugar ABC transporter substrate-binding protein [Pseudokineococcus lusitanus]ROP44791.1 carbohydrate ABC transporter substrate-binding protein (CUT1 family) [Pseudokineococcus lusitanus]
MSSPTPSRRLAARTLRGTALVAVLGLTLAACGGGDGSPEDVAAAVEEGGTLTVWAWDPTMEQVAADFETANPGVTVELANVGTGNDQYTALQNAISAGSGGPDVAQVEYYALPQFVLGEALADLGPLGADDLEGTYTPGPWNAVQAAGQGEGIYGLPIDSGPMALFYNAAVFEEAGVEVPTTWDEYVEAGRQIHAALPDTYITADTGDAGFATSLIWQAGGEPFTVDGTDVGIDLADEGSARFAEMWQPMIDEELLAPINPWTDEWFAALGGGQVASLVTGAWMPGNLVSGAADASGDWRVAPMPQWEEGGAATSENGGSSLAVMEASEQQELAYAFLDFAAAGDGIASRVEEGAFPATVAELESEEFLAQEPEYFGGQRINEVLAESATEVVDGWQYLPFQVYANSVFNDTVGQAYVGGTTLSEGLQSWQGDLTTYGEQQGFGTAAR